MQVHLDGHLQRAIPQPQTAQTAAAPSRGQKHLLSKLQGPVALKQTHVAEKGEKSEKASRKRGNGALLAALKFVSITSLYAVRSYPLLIPEVWKMCLLEAHGGSTSTLHCHTVSKFAWWISNEAFFPY